MTSQFKIQLNNDLQQIDYLREQLAIFCERFGLTDDTLFKLTLCLEELFVNTVSYGFEAFTEHEVLVYLEVEQDLLRVEVVDDGVPFDPFGDAPQPDLQAPVEQRPIGGLGVHLVKSLSDSAEYRFHENQNHIYLTMRIQSIENSG